MTSIILAGGAATYLSGMAAASIIGAVNGKCVSSPIVSVGCESTTDISMDINSITEVLNTQIQKITQNFTNKSTLLQDQNIIFKGPLCKNTEITQSLKVDAKMQSEFTGNFMNEAKNILEKDLNTKLDNFIEQTTELLGAQSKSDLKSSISATITDTLNTYCSLENINNVKNEVFAQQSQTITIVNTSPDCENLVINQELIINQITEVVSAQISANILSNEYLLKVVEDITNKLKQESKGLNSIVDSIMNFLKTFGIIIAIVIVVAIIGFVWFIKSGGAKGGISVKTSKGGSFNLGPAGKTGSSFFYF